MHGVDRAPHAVSRNNEQHLVGMARLHRKVRRGGQRGLVHFVAEGAGDLNLTHDAGHIVAAGRFCDEGSWVTTPDGGGLLSVRCDMRNSDDPPCNHAVA